MKRWLKRHLLLPILCFFSLLFIGCSLLVGTETGLKFLIAQAERWIPGKLTVKTVQGRLIDDFRFSDISYQFQDLQVKITDFQFAWQVSALLDNNIHIQQLQIDNLEVDLPATHPSTPKQPQDKPTPLQIPDIQLPVQIAIDDLKINKIAIKSTTAAPILINSIALKTTVTNRIELQQLAIKSPQFDTSLTGYVALKIPHNVNLQTNWSVELPKLVKTSGKANITGTLENYRVEIDSRVATKQLPQSHWTIAAQGDLQQVTLDKLHGELLKGTLELTGHVQWIPMLTAQLTLNTKQLILKELAPEIPAYLILNSQLVAKLTDRTVEITQLAVNLPNTPSKLTLHGHGSVTDGKPQFDVTLAWQNLQFPVIEKTPLVSSNKGEFTIKGTPNAYKIQLNTNVTGKDVPNGQWTVIGQGDDKKLNLSSLQGQLLDGAVELQGLVSWKPMPQWQLTLKGDNINPGKQWQELPGKLAFAVQSQGHLKNGLLEAQVDVQKLEGKLRNYPLKFQTQANVQGKQYQIKKLDFQSGSTRLTANGEIAQTVAVNWTLNAPDLSNLLPKASGNLIGKGHISGTQTLPHLIATLTGKNLVFQDKKLATLLANLDINLQNDQKSQLSLTATDLSQGTAQLLEELKIQGQGTVSAHTVSTTVKTKTEHLALQLTGSFIQAQQRWQGVLQQLTVGAKKLGDWTSVTPVTLGLAADKVQLDPLCLKNANSQVCTQINWQANTGSTIQINLTQLPLSLAKPFLPPDMSITGLLEGKLSAALRVNGSLQADSTLNISPGSLKTNLSGELQEFKYQGGALQLQITEQGLNSQLKLSLLKHSEIQGSVKLPNFTRFPLPVLQPIQGQLQATFGDLHILPTFVHQTENTQGTVKLGVTVGGTLVEPLLQWKVQIIEASTDLPSAGLQLKHLNVTLYNENQNTLKLQANLQSGQGKLAVNGDMKLVSFTDWKANLHIEGDKLEVINIPAAWAIASPNINAQLLPGNIEVTGTVTIPEAAITPTDSGSEGAVVVSNDVVIVNPKTPKPVENSSTSSGIAIASAVKIVLGDKVTFKGMGFKSHLGGSLLASNKPHKATIGNGELYILNGTYKAYGQDLKIEKGRVIFAGGLIDNPGLDIRAFRRVGDVTAGVRVQGTAQSPQVSLYSEPALDQTNTLSYIVLGRPAAQASKGEGQSLLAAAAMLPLGQGEDVTKKIGQQLGLDEMTVASDKGAKETALTVGKYLTPKLYISYGIGLFDASNILKLRYQLTKKLVLETQTGTQSGVDLRYTLEQ